MAADQSATTPGNGELPDVAWLRLPASTFGLQILRVTPAIVVAALHGRIDHDATPRFRDAVAAGVDAGTATLVFDLSEASFIDATALGVIVSAARRLGPDAVVLVVPYRGLRRVFRACGLDRALRICETREMALRGLPDTRPDADADAAAVTSPRRRPARIRGSAGHHATASARRTQAV